MIKKVNKDNINKTVIDLIIEFANKLESGEYEVIEFLNAVGQMETTKEYEAVRSFIPANPCSFTIQYRNNKIS